MDELNKKDMYLRGADGNFYLLENAVEKTIGGRKAITCDFLTADTVPKRETTGIIRFSPEIQKRLSSRRAKKIMMSLHIPRNCAEELSKHMVQMMPEPNRKVFLFRFIKDGAQVFYE